MGLGDEGTRMLIEGLKWNKTLTSLDLYGNGTKERNEGTRNNRMIKWIGNDIGEEGIRMLCESLKINTVLTILDLGSYGGEMDIKGWMWHEI